VTREGAFVIVGASLTGAKAAETLRDEGYDGPLVLLGSETERPYERPPLSKGYLLGESERDSVFVHPRGWYAEHDVDLRLGVTATGLDLAGHSLSLDDGTTLGYRKLLLATGSRARTLHGGHDLAGVHTLRTLHESDSLRAAFSRAPRVVVVGAGWIGLETAAAARAHGAEVTVIEPQPTPLYAALGPELGQVFARLHSDHGVTLRLGTGVSELRASGGHVAAVATSEGEELPADVVIVGVGIRPNVELAQWAGLTVDDGVVTDELLRTSDPDVYAAGDVASSLNPMLGRRIRVEHWANALNGGPAAARSMLGQTGPYDRLPYFFSDQYDLGMEFSGLAGPGDYDRVVYRGDLEGREFVAFWLRDDRVVAGMNVNVWDVNDAVQRLIRSDGPVDVERLTDPDVPLETVG
jgi:3-phenylpropionate/trans-cinnamate dioxygenase ferredoxin reductase subunit